MKKSFGFIWLPRWWNQPMVTFWPSHFLRLTAFSFEVLIIECHLIYDQVWPPRLRTGLLARHKGVVLIWVHCFANKLNISAARLPNKPGLRRWWDASVEWWLAEYQDQYVPHSSHTAGAGDINLVPSPCTHHRAVWYCQANNISTAHYFLPGYNLRVMVWSF